MRSFDKKSYRSMLLAALLSVGAFAHAGTFTTYAAWSDVAAKNRGHMYIYTGNYPSTDITLYNATAPNVSMAAVYCGFPILGVGPYQPVFQVGSCPVPPAGGFGNNYFKCQSTNPIIWEVEENIISSEEDSHDFLAAADTTNYIGTVFMTYMRDDTKSAGNTDYGDQIAIFNPGATNTTVTVRRWTGTPPAGSWGAVLITSPSIPPKGVWMWSPNTPATHDRGGTDVGNEGNYRFDVAGGTGMLYKGNTFGPFIAPGNRDNLIHMGPDIGDGTKVGDDLLGVVVTDGGAPHIVITNQGGATANYDILKFNPTTQGFFNGTEYLWPVDGDDPTGTWTTVSSGTIPVNNSAFYNAGALTQAGFYRVKATNGQPLSAEFGSAILQQTWCDGDYLYATDTRRAFGRLFNFGGKFFNAAAATSPVQVHVVCPIANTTVNMTVDGSISGLGFINQTQTNTVPDAGLAFPFAPGANALEFWNAHITANKIVYVYIMSSTDAASTAPGETFFSVPPPIDPILLVTKSVSQAVATIGDTLTYTLVSENPGSGNVTNAKLWDTLPAGITFVSANPAPTLSASPLYEWNLGTIGSLGAVTVNITVRVTAGTQLEVKHNTASDISDLTNQFDSNDAPVTILIPGADLQKSVNKAQAQVGDTLTYILSYTNTQPPLPGTPKLDLLIKNSTDDANSMTRYFKVVNNSGASINITDLQICEFVYDDAPPGNVQYANDYGGGTNPYTWGGPTLTATKSVWSPPQTLPTNRKANLKLCVQASTSQTLAAGQEWLDIQQRFYCNYPESWDNHADDYSQNPGAGYTEDHHFALYYQGKLVTEYTNSTTPDPETGLEPGFLFLNDQVPANVTYMSSTPSASVSLPYLNWTLDAVPPATTKSFTWWGTINAGTPAGTVIPNSANYTVAAGPGLSNRVDTLVGSANLTLVKSINKNIFTVGETVHYCIAWTLTGTASVHVVITDPLDPILTYVSSTMGGTISGQMMTWDLGTQAAPSSGSVCVDAFVNGYPYLPELAPFRLYASETWAQLFALARGSTLP